MNKDFSNIPAINNSKNLFHLLFGNQEQIAKVFLLPIAKRFINRFVSKKISRNQPKKRDSTKLFFGSIKIIKRHKYQESFSYQSQQTRIYQ